MQIKTAFFRLLRRFRVPLIVLAALFLALALFAGWSNWMVLRCSDAVYSDLETIPARRVGLVLGTQPSYEGRPNLYFDYRIAAAAKLYRAGKIEKILVSGDHGRMDYNEPEAMRIALVAAGVADSDIVLDYAGFRTLDSVVRSQEVFEAGPVTVISQEFHCLRAIYIARRLGIDAIGYAARDLSGRHQLKMAWREFFARPAAWLDVNILDRRPRYLGEKEPI